MTISPIFKKTFKSLGLNDAEAKVLLSLFQYSSQRVAHIAKDTKLNRTTIYGILKQLVSRGLVSSIERKGILEYQAIQPNLLIDYIERQKNILEESKKEIAVVMPELIQMRAAKELFPRVQFFEGIEGVKQAYEDTLQNNHEKILYDFTGTDAVFEKMGEEWVDYYIKKRVKLGIKCFDIAPDSGWSQKSKKYDQKFNRITKLLPPEYAFDTEIDIYDNKVAVFSFSKKQLIAVIIEDEQIAKTLKTLFLYIEKTL